MRKWYKNAKELVGPLLVIEGIEAPKYEEIVKIKTKDGEKVGRVLEAEAGRAVIQVFSDTTGMDLENTKVSFTGETLKTNVTKDVLGRVLSGTGTPLDGGPELFSNEQRDINGSAINPTKRKHPHGFVQTGVSAIDVMSPIVAGQKIPIFSIAGLPHNQLAAQMVRQLKFSNEAEQELAVVFGAIGATNEDYIFFKREFEKVGVMANTAMFVNLVSDSIVDRLTLPRLALTHAEHLAYDNDMTVVVILTDITNYCSALREISSARKEVPGRRSYPGYMYTDLAMLYERCGQVEGSSGSITQVPILTMPEGDKTHPIPDLTGYITEGQIMMTKDKDDLSITPPIDVLGSLSRMMGKGIGDGDGKTREDHPGLANQLFANYAKGLEMRELAQILGEGSLSEIDREYLGFAKDFEQEFINQGYDNERTIAESLDLGWKLLKRFPKRELKKVKSDHIKKYMK